VTDETEETGTWVFIKPEPHECYPPAPFLGIGQKPPGSVWRCECGALWRLNIWRDWVRGGWITHLRFRQTKKED